MFCVIKLGQTATPCAKLHKCLTINLMRFGRLLLVAEERIGSAILRTLVSALPVETELIPTGTTKVSGEADIMTQARKLNQFMTGWRGKFTGRRCLLMISSHY